jgi:hypothetical protein
MFLNKRLYVLFAKLTKTRWSNKTIRYYIKKYFQQHHKNCQIYKNFVNIKDHGRYNYVAGQVPFAANSVLQKTLDDIVFQKVPIIMF